MSESGKPRTSGRGAVTETNQSDMAAYLDRILRLEEEKQAISDDIKAIWDEAKSSGFDVKAMRRVHSIRKLDHEERSMLGVYVDKLGLFD